MGTEPIYNRMQFRLFKSDIFNDCFEDLFKRQEDHETGMGMDKTHLELDGPMRIILNDYTLCASKGGSGFCDYNDTTYFIHALNTVYIGSVLFENYLIEKGVNIEKSRNEIRLFMMACVLHDFNKLESGGIYKPSEYADLLKDKRAVLSKLALPYLLDGRNIINANSSKLENILNDLSYLILSTELGTTDAANIFVTSDRSKLELIARFCTVGDEMSSILSQRKDPDFLMDEVIKSLRKHAESLEILWRGKWKLLRIRQRSQTMLRNLVMQALSEAIIELNGQILTLSPTHILFRGDFSQSALEKKAASRIESKLSNRGGDESEKLIGNFMPKSNKIDLSFSKRIHVTRELLLDWVSKYPQKFLLQQLNPELKPLMPSITFKIRQMGYPLSPKENSRLVFDIPDDVDPKVDPDIESRIQLTRLAAFIRLSMNVHDVALNDTEVDRVFGEGTAESCHSITLKTLHSIIQAHESSEDREELIQKYAGRLAEELGDKYDGSHRVNTESILNAFVSSKYSHHQVQDKLNQCIQCGEEGDIELKESVSFGFKATSGGGQKVSVLKDDDKHRGKLCELCVMENELRRKQLGVKDKNKSLMVFLGDYIPPVSIDGILQTISDRFHNQSDKSQPIMIQQENGKERYVIKIGGNSFSLLDRHSVAFVSFDDKIYEQFWVIRTLLSAVESTGLKVRISSLFGSFQPQGAMFEWENAPSWVREFHLDSVRIDRIHTAKTLLELFLNIGKMRGLKMIPQAITRVGRDRLSIFVEVYEGLSKMKSGAFSRKLKEIFPDVRDFVMSSMESEEMKMEELVEMAIRIDSKAPVSRMDNSWIIREAIGAYERSKRDDPESVQENIAANLWSRAQRRFDSKEFHAGASVQKACLNFGQGFVDFMEERFSRQFRSDTKKDIIAQFSILYNIKKWESVKKKGGE